MKKLFGLILILSMLSMISICARADDTTKEQVKGLDEQVQDIKTDVLSISAQLNLLEEKLLYPSNTYIAFFVSLEKGSSFVPDAIGIKLDNKDVADYIYSYKEVQALQKGGVQRVFTGNVTTGPHTLQVTIKGKDGGSNSSNSGSSTVTKGVGPQFVEIHLTNSGVQFRNW